MDPQDLRVFISVYEARNFLRASEALRVSQSSVSARIANLEREFGELFVRLPRGVIPTEKAHVLYRYAQRMVALSEETVRAVKDAKGAA